MTTWQTAPLVAPDEELKFATLLRPLIRAAHSDADMYVGTEVPNPRRDRFVTIRRDGGPQRGAFDHPRFGIRCWGTTEQDAADLARRTVAALLGLAGSSSITQVLILSGPSPVADPSEQPLRFVVAEATVRM